MTTSIDTGLVLDPRTFLGAKTDQAVEILKEKGIDVWVTYVRESIANADPCLELIFEGDLTWESALILTADGEKIAIVGIHDAPDIEAMGVYNRVIGYREGISEPLVHTILRIDPRSIAVNFSENDPLSDGLGTGLLRLLKRRLEGTIYVDRLVSAEDVIWSLRGQKLEMEVEAIRRSVRETERILAEAAPEIRPGVTDREIAAGIRGRALERGFGLAWTPKMCPIVTIGTGSRVGHVTPSGETVVPGCLVHVDFGIRASSYCSDLQRLWYVANGSEGIPAPVQHAFRTVVHAIELAAQGLKPGVQGWEIDEIARNALKVEGYDEFQHALGHQIGRSPHDGGGATLAPRWERYNETPFRRVEAGNVFTIEPSIHLPEYGLVGVEENVLVTEYGCEFLSNRQVELSVLPAST